LAGVTEENIEDPPVRISDFLPRNEPNTCRIQVYGITDRRN
jgi:hypothetical protein